MASSKDVRDAVRAAKEVREAVKKELEFDRLSTRQAAPEEHDRDVALNGTVPSYPQYLQAAAAAKRAQDRRA